jgi:hypothetical protein
MYGFRSLIETAEADMKIFELEGSLIETAEADMKIFELASSVS